MEVCYKALLVTLLESPRRASMLPQENFPVKGIFSDSNNIFLWHESEDINKKSLFPKFQLIPILRL